MTDKIHLKSALIGAVATLLIMMLCSLLYNAVSHANERYEQGQKAMIERHKLENKGVL